MNNSIEIPLILLSIAGMALWLVVGYAIGFKQGRQEGYTSGYMKGRNLGRNKVGA